MTNATPTDSHIDNVVLFGATGDLARRMLLPSLFSLDRDGLLADDLTIVGAARSDIDDESFIGLAKKAVYERCDLVEEGVWLRFAARLRYCRVDVQSAADFERLSLNLQSDDQARSHLFFLSLSPDNYIIVCDRLGEVALNTPGSKIVVEKPIGRSRESGHLINAALLRSFDESRIFRIDHYLGKETVQNILALRFGNLLFEPLWNRSWVDHVIITVYETVGVEGRWGYYDSYGALRDMVQNHVLQLLCLIAMEPPSKLHADAVRDEKVKVIRSLTPIRGADVQSRTVRGQYRAGISDGRSVAGYADEADGKVSDTETYVAIKAEIDTWRWSGVPFILRTGKRMGKRLTEIQVQFRELPHSPFGSDINQEIRANKLTITLQPDEHVALHLMNKTPGLNSKSMHMSPLALNLSLSDTFHSHQKRIAYEQLLLDALSGNQTLFVRADETDAAWCWIDDIIQGWHEFPVAPEPYAAGSKGPRVAERLLERKRAPV